jgi:pimeloyl-ACP methyl ester carboxylesterase
MRVTTYSTIILNLGFGPQPIAYFDRDASGTPVLFVHGLGNAASNFEDTLAARARIRWRHKVSGKPESGRRRGAGAVFPIADPVNLSFEYRRGARRRVSICQG